jgi:hypothetical protein
MFWLSEPSIAMLQKVRKSRGLRSTTDALEWVLTQAAQHPEIKKELGL